LRRDTRVGEREEVARCRAQGQRKCEGAGETESEREREMDGNKKNFLPTN